MSVLLCTEIFQIFIHFSPLHYNMSSDKSHPTMEKNKNLRNRLEKVDF